MTFISKDYFIIYYMDGCTYVCIYKDMPVSDYRVNKNSEDSHRDIVTLIFELPTVVFGNWTPDICKTLEYS